VEISFSNAAQTIEIRSITFSTNSTNFIPTKRVLSGTWALQGKADGHVYCLAIKVA